MTQFQLETSIECGLFKTRELSVIDNTVRDGTIRSDPQRAERSGTMAGGGGLMNMEPVPDDGCGRCSRIVAAGLLTLPMAALSIWDAPPYVYAHDDYFVPHVSYSP